MTFKDALGYKTCETCEQRFSCFSKADIKIKYGGFNADIVLTCLSCKWVDFTYTASTDTLFSTFDYKGYCTKRAIICHQLSAICEHFIQSGIKLPINIPAQLSQATKNNRYCRLASDSKELEEYRLKRNEKREAKNWKRDSTTPHKKDV
jgi:hypothetical protein